MSGTATADATGSKLAPRELIDELTFESSVNEVFLLIDHISGRSEKSLKQVDTAGIELPAPQGEPKPPEGAPAVAPPTHQGPGSNGGPSISDVLHRLCQIGYPPDPDSTTKAHKAAFVLMLKDRLNALASPARGLTVAYTAMFVSATYGRGSKASRKRGTSGGTNTMPHSTRGDLARDAYPGLETHARRFAAWFRAFPYLMAIVLILTASAYWDVGFGRTVVQRIEQTNKERVDLLRPDTRVAPAAVLVTETSCAAPAGLSDDQARACAQLASLTQRLKDWRADLFHFAVAVTGNDRSRPLTYWVGWLRPISYGFLLNGQLPPEDRPEATVAWVLSLYSTYVLPAMFGFLGTLAAIMRAIQAKVRDSLLGPRDFPLSVLGLVVGPVAGLAVGLFYTPTDAATASGTGLAATVSLSASGLGFMAGYGAEAFFRFVDALLVRVFALEQPSK